MNHTRKNAFLVLLLAMLFAAAYYPTVVWMVDRWGRAGSYYSHGYLVVPVVALLVWRQRSALGKAPVKASGSGLLLMVTALIVHLAASLWRVHFPSGLSMIMWLVGLVLWLWGPGAARLLLFPLLFLVSMVPMPLVTEAAMTLRLKLFATRVSLDIVNMLGVPAVQEGSQIHLGSTTVIVGDVCSGLRSIIALLSLGALMAYLSRLSRPAKLILFGACLPFALVGNIVRIVWSCLAASWFGPEADAGMWHTVAGLITFAVALALIAALERSLLYAESRFRSSFLRPPMLADAVGGKPELKGLSLAPLRPRRLAAPLIMMALAGLGTLASAEGEQGGGATAFAERIPMQMGAWVARDLPISDSTLRILETRDVIVREYVNSGRESVYLAVIFAENNRKVAHPPEVCYAGAGWEVESKHTTTLAPGFAGAELSLIKPGQRELVLYWYGLGRHLTPNYYWQQLHVVFRQIFSRRARVSLVRISTAVSGSTEEAHERLTQFAFLLLPHLDAES